MSSAAHRDAEESNSGGSDARRICLSFQKLLHYHMWPIIAAVCLAIVEAVVGILIDWNNDDNFPDVPTIIGIVIGVLVIGTPMNYVAITSSIAKKLRAMGARVLSGERKADHPSRKIEVFNVPEHHYSCPRPSVEDKVLKTLKKCLESSRKGGKQVSDVLVIYGGDGIGKSSLISNIFNNRQSKLAPLFEIVVWIPCGRWRDGIDHPEKKEEFENVVLSKATLAVEPTVPWKNLKKMVKFFMKKKQRAFFVFDHCYHNSIIRVFLRESDFLGECMAIITHESLVEFSYNLANQENGITFVGLEIGPVKQISKIIKIFESDPYRLHEAKLTKKKMHQLAEKCRGYPLLAKYVAGRFSGVANHEEIFVEIKQMSAKKLSIENLPKLFCERMDCESEKRRLWYSGLALLFGPNHPIRMGELIKLFPGSEKPVEQALTNSRESLTTSRHKKASMKEKGLVTVVQVRKRDDQNDKETAIVIHKVHFVAAKMLVEKYYLGSGHEGFTSQKSEDMTISDYRCYILARLNKCNCPFRDRDIWLRKAVDMRKAVEIFKFLAKTFPDSIRDRDGNLPLHLVVMFPQQFDPAMAELLAERNPEVLTHERFAYDSERGCYVIRGSTPLRIAVESDQAETVRAFAEIAQNWFRNNQSIGKNVLNPLTMTDENKRTPLAMAAYLGYTKSARVLVEYNRKVLRIKDKDGLTPLALAGQAGHRDTAKVLSEVPFDAFDAPQRQSANFNDALRQTGDHRSQSLLGECKQDGFMIPPRPLHHAVRYGNPSNIQHGVAGDALHKSVQHSRTRYGRRQQGSFSTTGTTDDDEDVFLLQHDTRSGNPEADETALHTHHETGVFPVQYDARAGTSNAVVHLSPFGSSNTAVSIPNRKGMLPINHAARTFSPESVTCLPEVSDVSSFADNLNEQDMFPVRYDARAGSSNAASTVDQKNRFPLHYAVQTGNLKAVKKLLGIDGASAFVYQPDENGMLPIHYAGQVGNIKVVNFLCEFDRSNIAVNTADMKGMFPLHHAARLGKFEIINVLLEADGSNTAVQTPDHEGMLPLHHAAASRSSPVIATLEKKYPQAVYIRDKGGMLPVDHSARGRPVIVHHPDEDLDNFNEVVVI